MQERSMRSTSTNERTDGAPPTRRARRRVAAGAVAAIMAGGLLAASPAVAAEPFTELIDFEDYQRAALNGQDG